MPKEKGPETDFDDERRRPAVPPRQEEEEEPEKTKFPFPAPPPKDHELRESDPDGIMKPFDT